MMPPGMGMMSSIGTDTIYSFVIIFVSLMIFRATKGLYDLSQHKGIKFFCFAFLFFAFAYAFRFLTQFIVLFLGHPRSLGTDLGAISVSSLFFFMYASTAAIFYLWASNHWRWFERASATLLLHICAFAISFLGIVTQNAILIGTIQVILIATLALTSYQKNNRDAQKLRFLYVLLAVFWALNLIDLLLPKFLSQVQLIIYLASISLFLVLLQKVIKKT